MQSQFQNMNKMILPTEALLQTTREQMKMAKPQKWIPRLQKTAAAVICTMLIFMGAVNLSPAFASAAAKVPIVRELVAAVSFDPSMKAAIAHNYIQLVKQSDRDNGFQLDVEYLVADQANLTVYYRLQGLPEDVFPYNVTCEIKGADGTALEASGSWGWAHGGNALSFAKFYLMEDKFPEHLQFVVTVKVDEQAAAELEQQGEEDAYKQVGATDYMSEMGEEPPLLQTVAELKVPLTIDHNSLFNARTIPLKQTVEVAGQKLFIEQVEIYPTQMRLLWHEDANNDCLISEIKFALWGQKHRRWESISNGISGIGMPGEPRQAWLESSWFSDDNNKYQLQIEEVSLLAKQQQPITYDYRTNTITNLPKYIQLQEAVPCETGLYLNFQIQSTDTVVGSVFANDYLDGNGVKQSMFSQGASSNIQDIEEKGAYFFDNSFVVKNYADGPITLYVQWAPPQKLAKPVVISVTEK